MSVRSPNASFGPPLPIASLRETRSSGKLTEHSVHVEEIVQRRQTIAELNRALAARIQELAERDAAIVRRDEALARHSRELGQQRRDTRATLARTPPAANSAAWGLDYHSLSRSRRSLGTRVVSIEGKTTYCNFEIVLVDNGSREIATHE